MEFKGKYWFLSNSSQYPFDYNINNITYRFQCADAAFEASKCPERANEFVGLSGREAKALGKTLKTKEIRKDWKEEKLNILLDILREKFKNPQLAMQLATIDGPILFDNSYHDIYWGLYQGKGQNHLGKLLTKVQEEIKKDLGLFIEKEPDVVSYKIQKGGIVSFDTETTGLSSKYDDILQITIAGQDGSILLSTYVKPQNCTSWPEAEKVHHISPDMVKDAPDANKVAKIVRKIFDHADVITGYNIGFDIKMTAARFGYDFQKKEQITREKYSEKWGNLIQKTKEELLSIAIDYKNWKESKERKIPENLKENPFYQILREDKVNLLYLEENTPYLEEIALKYTPNMSICDVLPLYRKYTKEEHIDVSHKLVDACEYLCPVHFAEFQAFAHDAAADTIATIEVTKELCKRKPEYFESSGMDPKEVLLQKNRWGENKLFGISSGIVCHQVNCQGTISKGFTKRLYQQYPALKRDFYQTYDTCKEKQITQFGKVKLFTIVESEDLQVASIYSQEKNGDYDKTGIIYTDAEKLVQSVSNICKQFPDKPVYLPCIMTSEIGPYEVIDGIGCGKSGEKWSKLGPMFEALQMKNLYLLDTQTGRCEAIYKEKALQTDMEDDLDFEIG